MIRARKKRLLCMICLILIILVQLSWVNIALPLKTFHTAATSIIQGNIVMNFFKPSIEINPASVGIVYSVQPSFVIFYNIFIPDSEEMIKNNKVIVSEQLNEVANAFASNSKYRPLNMPKIHFKTIGKNNTDFSDSFIKSTCEKIGLECLSLGHNITGFEEVILGTLHEYCNDQMSVVDRQMIRQNMSTPWVIYLHNKGSFHYTKHNNNWRTALTKAALSDECRLYAPEKRCSACGLLFMPIWTSFYPGNIWSASCDYVSKLMNPQDFQTSLSKIQSKVMNLKREDRISTELYRKVKSDHFGIGRYSNEHWIGSHPEFSPCDVSNTANIRDWWNEGVNFANFSFDKAPRHKIDKNWFRLDHTRLDKILNDHDSASKEYFLLPGFLWRGWQLYKTYPPPSSWVWSWFPDGPKWKTITEGY